MFLLDKKLWCCRLQVISSLTLSSIAHKKAWLAILTKRTSLDKGPPEVAQAEIWFPKIGTDSESAIMPSAIKRGSVIESFTAFFWSKPIELKFINFVLIHPFSWLFGVPFFSHFIPRLHAVYLKIKPWRYVTASDRSHVNVTKKTGDYKQHSNPLMSWLTELVIIFSWSFKFKFFLSYLMHGSIDLDILLEFISLGKHFIYQTYPTTSRVLEKRYLFTSQHFQRHWY